MDSIDIADIAFSLAAAADLSSAPVTDVVNEISSSIPDINNVISSIPDINNVVSSVTDIVDDANPGINIYLIVGFILLIGGLFLYSYFTNRAKKVTFNENVENYYNGNS
jgi:hypothetical protein